MAAEYLSLLDHMKRRDPDGKIRESAFAELLDQNLPILKDLPFREANGVTSHMTTIRSGIPTPTYRRMYEGVEQSKSTTVQVQESMGRLEDTSEVDEMLIDTEGGDQSIRASEDAAFIEGFAQKVGTDIFYSDISASPIQFHGLAPRYDTLGTPTGKPTANNYLNQVIGAGGTTANIQTSVWLLGFGPRTIHGIFPQGSQAGLKVVDNGRQRVLDANSKVYYAWCMQYVWQLGLCVRDWRYAVRIANVQSTATSFDYKLLIKAYNTIPNISSCSPVIYCNRTVKVLIDEAATGKANVFQTIQGPFGEPITTFWGIPIRTLDCLVNTEAVVS